LANKGKYYICIIDSDEFSSKKLDYLVSMNPEFGSETFRDTKSFLDKKFKKYPDLIIINGDNEEVQENEITKINQSHTRSPLVIYSNKEEIEDIIALFKIGIADYWIADSINNQNFIHKVNAIIQGGSGLKTKQVKEDIIEAPTDFDFSNKIIGGKEMQSKVFRLMEVACKNDMIISITGDTGTGKDLIAKEIHRRSLFRKGKFIVVNCNTLNKELAESELFGHEEGAFTGAKKKRIGKFEEANGGTIYFDDISGLNNDMQSKLLRVIQEKEFKRIGGNETIEANARVIVASTKNLTEQVKKGTLRKDLYYRFNQLPIYIPSLIERPDDIMLYARDFVEKYAKKKDLEPIDITDGAEKLLREHPWPGNVRELLTTLERTLESTDLNRVSSKTLIFHSAGTSEISDVILNEEYTMEDYRQKIIQAYLNKYNNVNLVAKKLNIGRVTIFRMLKRMRAVS